MIKVDENEPIGELEAKFPYRDVRIKRGVDVKEFYDLEAEIGRGKFGTVYLCREKITQLSLAAKFVGIQRRQDRKNVEREVEIMRTLQHPRLIQLYDAFECNNTMVVVLELIEGGELFERVIGDDFILTEKACTIFMRQICEGVAFIHKNNIIHLDLKPENILCLTKTGNRIKIIDFGLARHYEPGNKLQVLFGTPEFVAPEVVNFEQISPATDMWSVGVICYVLLSGLSPFMGDTDVETMSNVTLGRYDFDDDSFDKISKNAKDFISNLLLKDKDARLTADMCLQHPWLKKKTPPPPPTLIAAKENLKVFVDNYQNSNAVVNHDVERLINPKPPALSAVELITASDKKFLNRDISKSFSNIGNDNILPPVRLHDLFATNNNVTPVVNDNEVDVSCLPSTNDQMLNIVNANLSSMLPQPPLDNVPTISPNVPFVSDSLPNREFKNNNTHIDSGLTLKIVEEIRNEQSANSPLADIIPRIVPVPEVPIAALPFISKSLPAAAAMIDENMVDKLKPLHIPLIPSVPITQFSHEPVIPHLPVVVPAFGLPIGENADKEKSPVGIGHSPKKRGSIDVLSLLYKRGSIDYDSIPRRGSHESAQTTSPLPSTSSSLTEVNNSNNQNEPPSSTSVRSNTEPVSANDIRQQPVIGIVDSPELVRTDPSSISPIPVMPILKPTSPLTTLSPPPVQETPILAPLPIQQDVILPPLPEVETAKITSEQGIYVTPLSIQQTSISILSPQYLESKSTNTEFATQLFQPDDILIKPHSPVSEPPRTSPISLTPTKRESPLQKTLDDIPKLSSEILSSLTKIPSLTRSTSYETSMSKTLIETRKTVNYSESNRSYERGRSPRKLAEHSSFDYSGSLSKLQSSALGRRNFDEKSAFSSITSKSCLTSSKRTDVKETEVNSSQHSLKVDADTRSQAEMDAFGFKQRLRTTAPWFSERKTASERNIEKRSTDMSNLLAENLGPLERSPWAREIRKISAKLVEMSKEQTARKQQEENHVAEMNEKSARRQKFKLSVLNRDVVFGAAREFYVGGEVPIVSSSSMDRSTKQTTQSLESYPSTSSSPKRKITPTYSSKSK